MNFVPELMSSRELVLDRIPQLERLSERFAEPRDAKETAIILALDESKAYYVGRELDRFDRELRRTAASARKGRIPLSESLTESVAFRERVDLEAASYAKPRSTSDERPLELRGSLHGTYPDHPDRGSLRLVASEQGSALLLLEAVGAVVDVLSSDPMTAIANAAAWSGPVRWVRAWFARSDDPLAGISARQALNVLKEFGADPSQIFGPPDGVVDLGTRPELTLPDGTHIRGTRRIHVVRKHPDGSTSWFEVE